MTRPLSLFYKKLRLTNNQTLIHLKVDILSSKYQLLNDNHYTNKNLKPITSLLVFAFFR